MTFRVDRDTRVVSVPITGVWLRTKVNDAGENENEVLVEVEGVWRLVISEPVDGVASAIVESSGIEKAPVDV
jgi:hypothetical protein